MKLPESLLDRWRIKLGIVLFSLIPRDFFFFTGRGTDLSIVFGHVQVSVMTLMERC